MTVDGGSADQEDGSPPTGVRTVRPVPEGTTRIVLVRHGEAICNVNGVIGGRTGCTGLTERGHGQAEQLADRLARTGELAGVTAVYSSVLARAVETAETILPALDRWREGPPLGLHQDCDLCELHPGEADGLTWGQFSDRFAGPDWDRDPDHPLAPGAESWSAFVGRASRAVADVAQRHPGGLVVVVTHAGLVESTVLRFLPVGPRVHRLGLHTEHTSMTVWDRLEEEEWRLQRFNDAAHRLSVPAEVGESGLR